MSSRICIVAPELIGPFPNGGVGTACYWEAMTLAAAGHEVSVLYTGPVQRETPEYWVEHFAQTAPFHYTDLGLWIARNPSIACDPPDPACPESRIADQVLAFLRGKSFDLVLFQEFLGHGARALQAHESASALLGTRTATTLHSCRQWIYEGMQRQPSSAADVAVDFLEKESARLAGRIFSPSAHMAKWAERHWHLAGPMDVVPYCYDDAMARPRDVIEHAGPFRHLVFFGRLETRKGLHLFCRALATDRELAGSLTRVTFLGKPSSVDGLPSLEFIERTLSAVPGLEWTAKSDLGSLEALEWLGAQRDVLVVAPSLVDNLPYSMIELYCRRVPFVSTHIGGIPEIVGTSNHHVLAPATISGLRQLLARTCREGRLTVDYRSGYDVADANDRHIDAVRRLLDTPARRPGVRSQSLSIVVTAASNAADVDRLRSRFMAVDRASAVADWTDLDGWRRRRSERVDSTVSPHEPDGPVLFVDHGVQPDATLLDRLLTALAGPGVDAVTSYYREKQSDDEPVVVAPLGSALESGWWQNCFGGPCLGVSAKALAALDHLIDDASFAYWPAYAALACCGHRQAMVPEALYTVAERAWRAGRPADGDTVIREYHEHASISGRLDVGWVLKAASSGIGADGRAGESTGQRLYTRLTSAPDDIVSTGADRPIGDQRLYDILQLRDRLIGIVRRWSDTQPRVFVYGAGAHAKLMLQICPEIKPLIAGFIDRRPLPTFLGLPCLRPEAFDASLADAVVYSSREFEQEMHDRLAHLAVEHVLLYHASPETLPPTSSLRLQRRFGHAAPNFAPLRAMYRPPAWAKGHISRDDAEFLYELIAAQQPRTVVEIGVASGASSAAILCALDQLPEIVGGRVLYSCDVRSTCYFDDAFATGQACVELYPSAKARWRTEFDAEARRLSRVLPGSSVDLTFIDANHAHPWPLLDLLHVTAVARARSWVVLHDIDLPIHYPEYHIYGPRWLFEAWPFNKVKGVGPFVSIAAVQLPEDPAALIAMAERLLARPWEGTPRLQQIDLPRPLAAIQEQLAARLAPADPTVVC